MREKEHLNGIELSSLLSISSLLSHSSIHSHPYDRHVQQHGTCQRTVSDTHTRDTREREGDETRRDEANNRTHESADSPLLISLSLSFSSSLLDAVKSGRASDVNFFLHRLDGQTGVDSSQHSKQQMQPSSAEGSHTNEQAKEEAERNDASSSTASSPFPLPRADANSSDADGSSCLHWAAWTKAASIFSSLLQSGADCNHRNSRGESVLEWAVRGGDTNLLAQLMTRPELNVHSANAFGGSATHIAAEEGHVSVLSALSLLGVNLDSRDCRGKTPLSCAAHRNRPAALQFLLRHGRKLQF